jgi:excisionase family DNA binding protein
MKQNPPESSLLTGEEISTTLRELKHLSNLLSIQHDIKKDKLLNFNETADYLGLSHSYLYKLTARKMIPCYKPMGRLYFFKNELDNWIVNNATDMRDGDNVRRNLIYQIQKGTGEVREFHK